MTRCTHDYGHDCDGHLADCPVYLEWENNQRVKNEESSSKEQQRIQQTKDIQGSQEASF